MRLGVVTCRRLPEPQPDDVLMLDALDDEVEIVAAPWDDESAPWERCAAVLIRSPWDYHERVEEFLAWAGRLEAAGTTLWNPASLVTWNARKSYLRELETAGVATVPTLWLDSGDAAEWPRAIEGTGWRDLVLKPIVGASSFLTWRMPVGELPGRRQRLERLAAHGGALVQPFVSEIVSRGEWSLIYFEGRFSHAVRKRAQAGEFRVQIEFGGSETPERPPARVEAASRATLERLPSVPLYARVDGVERGDSFVLTELELIEPVLFLGSVDGAAERFATAVMGRLAAC